MAEAASTTDNLARRVLVAVNACAAGIPALDAGVELAAALGAHLEGLFVEEAGLLHLAGLPFASEISALTGGWRSIAPVEIERALRVEAARLERLIEQAAERACLPWTFAITRGRLLAEAVARRADFTVLGSFGGIGLSARPPAASGRAPKRSVATLFDGSPATLRALVLSARLAKAPDGELSVFVPQGEPSSQSAACERAQSWLAAEQLAGTILRFAPAQGAFIEALRARRSAMLVLPVPHLTASLQELTALVADLWCPLIIVR